MPLLDLPGTLPILPYARILVQPCRSSLVRIRFLDEVDEQDVDWRFLRFQLKSELVRQRGYTGRPSDLFKQVSGERKGEIRQVSRIGTVDLPVRIDSPTSRLPRSVVAVLFQFVEIRAKSALAQCEGVSLHFPGSAMDREFEAFCQWCLKHLSDLIRIGGSVSFCIQVKRIVIEPADRRYAVRMIRLAVIESVIAVGNVEAGFAAASCNPGGVTRT